jgi:cephalosporin-C deacetylase-like acetyl esterase
MSELKPHLSATMNWRFDGRASKIRRLSGYLLALLLCVGASVVRSQSEMRSPKYDEVFYTSGSLRIQAYLYRPEGDGAFPAVIYNHGTRDGRERESSPFPHIGKMLTQAGYVALVPERRGYGKSDGEIWWQEVGRNQAHSYRGCKRKPTTCWLR